MNVRLVAEKPRRARSRLIAERPSQTGPAVAEKPPQTRSTPLSPGFALPYSRSTGRLARTRPDSQRAKSCTHVRNAEHHPGPKASALHRTQSQALPSERQHSQDRTWSPPRVGVPARPRNPLVATTSGGDRPSARSLSPSPGEHCSRAVRSAPSRARSARASPR